MEKIFIVYKLEVEECEAYEWLVEQPLSYHSTIEGAEVSRQSYLNHEIERFKERCISGGLKEEYIQKELPNYIENRQYLYISNEREEYPIIGIKEITLSN